MNMNINPGFISLYITPEKKNKSKIIPMASEIIAAFI